MISRDESIQPSKQRQGNRLQHDPKEVDPGMTGGGHQGEKPGEEDVIVATEVAVVEMAEDPAEVAAKSTSIEELRPHFAELDPVEVHHDAPQVADTEPGDKAA